MSAFSLPIPPATLAGHLRRLTERSATTVRGQMSDFRCQKRVGVNAPLDAASLAASSRFPGIHCAIVRPPHYRYSRDQRNSGSRSAFRRSNQWLSIDSVGTQPPSGFACRTLPPHWRKLTSRPGGFDPPRRTVQSRGTANSRDEHPARSHTPA